MASGKREAVVQITSYSRKLKDNVKSILDNYGEILKVSKTQVSDLSSSRQSALDAQVYHVENEVQVRAANIVRAAEVLFKMVSDLKEYLILNDFTAINETVTQHSRELHRLQLQTENELQHLYKDYHQRHALPRNE